MAKKGIDDSRVDLPNKRRSLRINRKKYLRTARRSPSR